MTRNARPDLAPLFYPDIVSSLTLDYMIDSLIDGTAIQSDGNAPPRIRLSIDALYELYLHRAVFIRAAVAGVLSFLIRLLFSLLSLFLSRLEFLEFHLFQLYTRTIRKQLRIR